jgi:transposase
MRNISMEAAVRRRFAGVRAVLNERQRRLWAAAEAKAVGYGGVSMVARVTGVSRRAIHAGLRELAAAGCKVASQRIRRPGGGRKPLTELQPTLMNALDALVEPTARGDPQSPLRWTCNSVRHLAAELQRQGFRIGRQKVADLLHELGYSLQANRKTQEGGVHPDRNAQFEHINEEVRRFQRRHQPVISVDTKKKELVGNFRNGGREWRPHGQPLPVQVHDFQNPELGKAIPYGVYDLTHDEAWVSVGVDHDTAEFAVESIRRWWRKMGRRRFPHATKLLVTADSGGSNSARCRLWKVALQRFADETGLQVSVTHFPPGTSKWNKIEHRLFCHITHNWRGQPLVSREIIVQLIGRTTTRTGLTVKAALDLSTYPKGIKVTDHDLQQIQLKTAAFHGDWNYSILPRTRAA